MNHTLSKNFVTYAKKNLFLMLIKAVKIYFIKYRKGNDHCHSTGKYRGAANNICNLR